MGIFPRFPPNTGMKPYIPGHFILFGAFRVFFNKARRAARAGIPKVLRRCDEVTEARRNKLDKFQQPFRERKPLTW